MYLLFQIQPRGGGVSVHHVRGSALPARGPGGGRGGARARVARRGARLRTQP